MAIEAIPEIEEGIAKAAEAVSSRVEEFLGKLLGGKQEASVDAGDVSASETADGGEAENATEVAELTYAEKWENLGKYVSALEETWASKEDTTADAIEACRRLGTQVSAMIADDSIPSVDQMQLQLFLNDLNEYQRVMEKGLPLAEQFEADGKLTAQLVSFVQNEGGPAKANLKFALENLKWNIAIRTGGGSVAT